MHSSKFSRAFPVRETSNLHHRIRSASLTIGLWNNPTCPLIVDINADTHRTPARNVYVIHSFNYRYFFQCIAHSGTFGMQSTLQSITIFGVQSSSHSNNIFGVQSTLHSTLFQSKILFWKKLYAKNRNMMTK